MLSPPPPTTFSVSVQLRSWTGVCLHCHNCLQKNSLDSAKRSFYRAANAVFGKIGRAASEKVTLEVIKTKCLPVLLYGLEVCPLTVSDLRALDFVVNRFFMMLFSTNLMDTVKICQDYFNFELPSSIVEKRRKAFVARYVNYSY